MKFLSKIRATRKKVTINCALLWQSIEPSILVNSRALKTCYTFWKKAKSVFANDIQRLYDSAQKLATRKQFDHGSTSFVTKAQSTMEELKMFLQVGSLEGLMEK